MHRAHRLYWRQLTQASSTRLHQNSKWLPSTTLHVQQCGHRLGKVGNSPHMPCLQTPAQGQPCKASWPPLRWTASGCYVILLRRSRRVCVIRWHLMSNTQVLNLPTDSSSQSRWDDSQHFYHIQTDCQTHTQIHLRAGPAGFKVATSYSLSQKGIPGKMAICISLFR